MHSSKPQHLMLPGPTPIPISVTQAMSGPMINHRSHQWVHLYREVEKGLKWAYQTKKDLLMFSGSGTTAMEAALVNTLSPGDKVIALVNGSFGNRFAEMASAFGADVERIEYTWGHSIRAFDLEERLKADTQKEIKAVLVVHSETSTGMLNPLKEIAALTHAHGALSIVDAVSSLMTTEIQVDAWHLDIVIGASQKSFMVPPGLAFLSVSPKAWKAYKNAKMPRYTLDFQVTHDYAQKGMTPWTPPISLFHALQESLRLMQLEGHPNILARHFQLKTATRAGLRALGLKLFIENPLEASRAVTPVYPPEGIAADDIRTLMRNNFNIELGSGQRQLTGKIFRIGHLGYQGLPDIFTTLSCLEKTLIELGHSFEHGASIAAAQAVLN